MGRPAEDEAQEAAAPMVPMEERWRAILAGETPLSFGPRLGRRLFSFVPSPWRCRFCNAPFRGPYAGTLRWIGYSPSRKNPQLCARCLERAPEGGAVVPVTVLFADVRGYTTLAEQISSVQVTATLNRFYEAASQALLAHEAVLGQIAGDQVMGLFVPGLAGRAYPRKAVHAAHALLRAVGYGSPRGSWLEVGVGICSGEEYVGNVGGGGFKDFSAEGDVTNTAARLQAVATGGDILLCAATYAAVHDAYPNAERRVLDLKGKRDPVEAFLIQLGGTVAPTETFDPVAFKDAQRADWQAAAPGWRRWYDVLEAEEGGHAVSRKLVELAAPGPGDAVLDVATGYGEPALTAARVVGHRGRVVATDIAADMLTFGRQRAAEARLDNVEFAESDAEALRFDDETFDAVLCRQGLQFLLDVQGTLRRFHAFLKREGRLAAAVWGPLETVQFALPIPVIFKELELPPPPPGRPGPFALADASALARLVADAGFRLVETGTVTAIYETASPEDFTQWTRDVAPPIVNLLRGQPADVQERIWRRVTEAWAPLVTSEGRVRTENQAIWLAATK